jgi:hypothetical protein
MSYTMCGHKMIFMDCFASLAMTDTVVLSFITATNHRHCEERSDEAIHVNKKITNRKSYIKIKNSNKKPW